MRDRTRRARAFVLCFMLGEKWGDHQWWNIDMDGYDWLEILGRRHGWSFNRTSAREESAAR